MHAFKVCTAIVENTGFTPELRTTMKHTSAHDFIRYVADRNPGQPEFLQAVTEVIESLWPFIEQHPRYAVHGVLE